MKIRLTCIKCAVANQPQPENMFADVRNDGLYDITCSNGHRSHIFLQNEKFDLLFESGVNALIDGYNREAVASMAAALERFLELYVKTITAKRDIPPHLINATWKHVSRQSERQLGAFFFLYLIENRAAPTYLSQTQIEFRNDVIHKGNFPSQDGVLKFGQVVLNFITSILLGLLQRDSILPFLASINESEELFRDLEEKTFNYVPTIIYQWLMENHQKLLQARLNGIAPTIELFEAVIDLTKVIANRRSNRSMKA